MHRDQQAEAAMTPTILAPRRPWRLIPVLAVSTLAAACGGGSSEPAMGTLKVSLTDAPACGYDEVNVTVESVAVHQSSTADDHDAGWQEIVLDPPKRVDLLDLTNGVLE